MNISPRVIFRIAEFKVPKIQRNIQMATCFCNIGILVYQHVVFWFVFIVAKNVKSSSSSWKSLWWNHIFFLWISLVRNFFRKGPGDLDIKFASQVCQVFSLSFWVVVSNIFHFHPHLGKWSNVTNIFRMGWNQQLGLIGIVIEMGSLGNPRRIFGDGCQ